MSIFPNHRLGSLFCPLAQLPPVCFLRAAPFVAILFTRPHGNAFLAPLLFRRHFSEVSGGATDAGSLCYVHSRSLLVTLLL